jgi:hypothetical protein
LQDASSSERIHATTFLGHPVRSVAFANRLAVIFLLIVLQATPGRSQEQQQSRGTSTQGELQDILLHLQDNLWDYLGNVPNFFADEHVVSDLKQDGAPGMRTTTDSIFRLTRSEAIGEAHTLNESREIKLVNRKTPRTKNIQGPAILSGVFVTGVSMVSLEMSRCFDYTLEPSMQLKNQTVTPIAFVLKHDVLDDPSCPGPEPQSGRAWIEPGSYHPLRVEMAIPNHLDDKGFRVLWTWSVDYAPVNFDSRQFWMPKTIISKAVDTQASAVWSFTATYSNYHKLTVKSRIITDPDEMLAQPQ